MTKKFLKKIIAQSEKDLQFVSACCSDGIVKIKEIKYLQKNKIFLLSIERFNKETNDENIRINSIIRFDYVNSSKSKLTILNLLLSFKLILLFISFLIFSFVYSQPK